MSDHFITVVYEGGVWRYDGSYMTAVQFTPVSTDVLVADVDYSADTIESAEGKSGVVNGIEYGYRSGDLVFYADQFAGSYNDGEFDITGSYFIRNVPLDGLTTTYEYDAFSNLTQVTDPKSHVTAYDYDGLNRLIETTLQNGADTVYAYNNRGNLASVTDPTDNVTSYTYDYLGRLKTESITVDSVARTETYWYDLAGQMTKMEDRLGQATFYDYDLLGRVYQERWETSGGTPVRTIGYEFDDRGRLAGVSEVDGSAVSVGADYGYTYDNLGRVTQAVHDIAGLTPDVTFAQTFNAAGNRTQLAATIGTTADFVNDFSYDALGQMTQVTQQAQSGGNAVAEKLVEFDYGPTGQFSEIRRYADLLENEYVARSGFSYDATGRLTDLTHSGGGLASAIEYSLGYDDHLLDIVTYGGKTFDFSYDTVDQLVDVDYSGTGVPTDEAYSHDDSGNRTNTGYGTGDHNRLLGDGVYTYQYDANGNRTVRFVDNDSSGTQTLGDTSITEYEWDHRNRLTRVTELATFAGAATQVVEYEYDAFNRLVTKTVDSDADGTVDETYHWGYDGDQAVLEFDGDTAGDVSHRYLWGPAVDQLLADETVDDGGAEDVLWTLGDWQGSVRHLATYDDATDVTTIANEKVYDAYGNVASETNSAVDTLFGYTGRMFDDDTGLQWNLNRWYDPVVGRFVSEDPIDFLADVNWYRYVGNSPGMGADPSGLAPGPHHGYPLHLGGAFNQPRWGFADPQKHTIAQNYLRSRFPYGDAGRAAWAKLTEAEQRALIAQSLRAAGVESKAIAANMDAMMAGAKPGVKTPRVGAYGKVIPVGTVICAFLIVATNPSVAEAGEISHDWRDSDDCTKGVVECATFRDVIAVESWWNPRSSVWGDDPNEFSSSTQVSPWVSLGEMSAEEAARFETEPYVIEQDSVLGFTIYNTERVQCRFNGRR